MLTIFAAIVGFMPNFLGHPDNYIEANPLKTPAHIVPEWYFLPFYAMLRAITFDILWINSKLAGVLAMFGSIAVLLLLPWLDTSRVRSGRYRPMFKVWFWLLVVDFVVLMWCGSQPPEQPFVIISQLATLYWFVFFLVDPAAPRHRREAAGAAGDDRGRLPGALRHRARTPWSAPRSASRPNERGKEHAMLKTTLARRRSPRRSASLGAAAPPRSTRRRQSPTSASRSRGRSAASTRRSCSAACRSIPRSAPPATACKFVPYRELAEHGGPAMSEEQMRAFAAHARRDRRRTPASPARRLPSDHFPHSPLENAPDLSADGQGPRRLPRPAGLCINQFLHGIGGPEYIASLLLRLHRRGEGGGRRDALREPRLPRRLDRHAAAAERRPGDLRRRHRGDRAADVARTSPPS